ncbi:hypothetical protein IQ06DRAFT_74774 [Phaeosphaeriaceae sp. SRC1lsM3a]|nr:hypothetical protein IQ06DRAFT_74774 [Stagonospora sp. SRC1lsM3a]
MHLISLVALLGVMAARTACSPFRPSPTTDSTSTAEPTCTINVLREPAIAIDCTFMQHTKTVTAYTDCGGCVMHTRALGVGLPCQEMTTMPGVTTTTVQACKTSEKYGPTAAPKSTPCD